MLEIKGLFVPVVWTNRRFAACNLSYGKQLTSIRSGLHLQFFILHSSFSILNSQFFMLNSSFFIPSETLQSVALTRLWRLCYARSAFILTNHKAITIFLKAFLARGHVFFINPNHAPHCGVTTWFLPREIVPAGGEVSGCFPDYYPVPWASDVAPNFELIWLHTSS